MPPLTPAEGISVVGLQAQETFPQPCAGLRSPGQCLRQAGRVTWGPGVCAAFLSGLIRGLALPHSPFQAFRHVPPCSLRQRWVGCFIPAA